MLFHYCFNTVSFIDQVSTHFTYISTCLSAVRLPTYSACWYLCPALMLNLIRISACYHAFCSLFPYDLGRLQPTDIDGYYLINAQLFCYAEVSNKGKSCEIRGVGIGVSHQGTENSIHMWNYTSFSLTKPYLMKTQTVLLIYLYDKITLGIDVRPNNIRSRSAKIRTAFHYKISHIVVCHNEQNI